MNTYKIFLASSSELEYDRKEFEILINRRNKDWVSKGAHLELVIWEDFLDCVSKTRLQDEYDKAIRECDLFVMLYSSKVGKYTAEEFQTAFDLFLASEKPKIYTYCKYSKDTQPSLVDFQEKLLSLGHFQTMCQNTEGFLLQFSQQLDKLLSAGFIKFAPDDSATVPHNLTLPPFKPEVFLGREDDLLSLKENLFQKNVQLTLVSGEGGMGKTTVVSEYFASFQNEYSHCAWVVSENNITDALLTALSNPMKIKYENNMSSQERMEKLVVAITALPKPCLLIIDNVDNPKDLEENYLTLRRLNNFHTLITTRLTKFHNASVYLLHTLPKEKSLEQFLEHYPYHDPSEDELFYQIREAVGGNTLVIEILAKNLALLNESENTYTLKNLLEDIRLKGLLETEESSSEHVETTYHAGSKLKYTKPSEIISTMYDLGKLTPQEVGILSCFAILPPESIETKSLLTLVSPEFNPIESLKSLFQKGWIEFSPTSRSYKCSPVIQEITRNKNKNLYEDTQYLINALKKQLEYDSNLGHPLHMSINEADLWVRFGESAIRVLPLKSVGDSVLCDTIGRYFQTISNLPKALSYFIKSNQILSQLNQTNPTDPSYKNNLAISYQNLGDVYIKTGDLLKTLQYYHLFKQLREELNLAYPDNMDYKNGQAISYSKLGDIYTNSGDFPSALTYYQQYNQLREELTRDFPDHMGYKNGLAISYSKLGDIYTKLDDKTKALDYFIRFNQVIEGINKSNPQEIGYRFWLALSLQNLGNAYSNLNNLPKALSYYLEYKQMIQELHQSYPLDAKYKYGLAVSLENLGDIYSQQEDFAKAEECLKENFALAQELVNDFPASVVYKDVLANSHARLGELFKNHLPEAGNALDHYREAERLWIELTKEAPGFTEYQKSLDKIQKDLS